MFRCRGVDSGILYLLGILVGYSLDVEVRRGLGSGGVMKWGRWIVGVTLVGWGRLGIGFALRLHLTSAIRAKRGDRAA